jgi:hypothetical protein
LDSEISTTTAVTLSRPEFSTDVVDEPLRRGQLARADGRRFTISSIWRSQRPSTRPSEQMRKRSPGHVGHGADLGSMNWWPAPSAWLSAFRAGAPRLALVDLALPPQPADMRVVVRHLGDAAGLRQEIDPAVPHVAEAHPVRPEPAEAQRGAHARALAVGGAEAQEVGVDGAEELLEDLGEAGLDARGGEPEAAGQELVIRSTAILLANSPEWAPPIPSLTAKTKSEPSQRGRARLAEVVHLVAVERSARNESSLFFLTLPTWDTPDQAMSWRTEGIFASGSVGSGFRSLRYGGLERVTPSPPSRRVANSKSMMQNRPSEAR